MADADVVCKQLGCGAAESALGEAAFGEGTGPIWLEKVNCKGTESSLWDCCSEPWGDSKCHHKEDAAVNCSGARQVTASPLRTDLPRRQPPADGRRDMVLIVICIVLGAVLCLVLIILGGQVRSARALRRDSEKYSNPFSEAVYEEIEYNRMREKLEMFGHSVSYSEDPMIKLQYYTGDSEEGNDPGSVKAAPFLSEEGYDDVGEISTPEVDPFSGQDDQAVIRISQESDNERGSQKDLVLTKGDDFVTTLNIAGSLGDSDDETIMFTVCHKPDKLDSRI
ncbi:scavenger receptor cysteine-rich type 1 protein M130-like [Alligator sinensis]|uniref:Scavenger receptor cysteine-rich type 1 protein M130-like n=1 Tax=Alligator sinensis TaxID=38654 RepID=A0A3Q0HJK7_ALLSI|nr:scavenger receptor cysteine-rich type 1 protein M130-like [Alligator sinensis]